MFHEEQCFRLTLSTNALYLQLHSPFCCPAAPDTGSKVGHPCDNPSPWSIQTMADVQRVYNPETKCKMKLKKALDMQNQCLIEINMATMTYKNLTLAQIVQRR